MRHKRIEHFEDTKKGACYAPHILLYYSYDFTPPPPPPLCYNTSDLMREPLVSHNRYAKR